MTGEDSTPGRTPAERANAAPVAYRADGWRRWQGADEASRAMANILAGPLAWGGVGWLADRWLGSAPWLLSIGIMLGFAGGLYLVWLRVTSHAERAPAAHSVHHEDQVEGDGNVSPARRQRPDGTGRPAV